MLPGVVVWSWPVAEPLGMVAGLVWRSSCCCLGALATLQARCCYAVYMWTACLGMPGVWRMCVHAECGGAAPATLSTAQRFVCIAVVVCAPVVVGGRREL